jgi:RNA polymerase sigma factor (sigma-70 family)
LRSSIALFEERRLKRQLGCLLDPATHQCDESDHGEYHHDQDNDERGSNGSKNHRASFARESGHRRLSEGVPATVRLQPRTGGDPLGRLVRTVGVMALAPRLDLLSDEALLAALGLGDPDAALAFVRRFQRRVYGLAYLITSDRRLAEDVAQQAFERAWRHAASFDGRRGSVATWLLAITRNVSIDACRVRRATPIDPVDLVALLPADDDGDPAASAVHRDALDRVRPALEALPVEQRRAVLLATMGGRTASEISDIEGIPIPTAKSRLRLGLAKLRNDLVVQGLS